FVQGIPAKHVDHQPVILGQRFPLWLGATGMAMTAYLSDAEIDKVIEIMRREHPIFNRETTFNTDQYRNKLKEIKKRGYAITCGDHRPDICALAAPIFDQTNAVIGALVVRGKVPSFDMEKAEKFSSTVVEMANKIKREIETLS
ncbi:MAG: hypothetical protein FWE89_03625, partial [Syntrophaceae bacterium]|nr:hypothetical protein [Syntrophaceae bacterium]